ncbi:hypothetical protein BDV95DRAFT_245980 [Massariosphaeria phaeospora]|uniref:tRNA-splicing endonuclease subunit Sen2 n=1 Tax=Massariosphaeria phaeospora TaxID=100035 RepID=A0A7C8HZ12_9PLEO|nr:hypothetical protein BDV95DRAFT_245980 [Massariosphaeria phaeospora]
MTSDVRTLNPQPMATNAVVQDAPKVATQSNAVKDASVEVRPKRPNYGEIHSKPLPLEVFPLPAFIPHNPLSIIRIAIAVLSHSIWPPKSHTYIHKAYFSSETESIHVTDAQSIRALWEQGFWGAGSLSRSEPRWLDQEKRKRGIEALQTSEEFTRTRREDRRQFKLERAKAEREVIEQQLRAEGKLESITDAQESTRSEVTAESIEPIETTVDHSSELPSGLPCDSTSKLLPHQDANDESKVSLNLQDLAPEIQDQEHLQLTLEEAFFLTYALGVLDIYKEETRISPSDLLLLYCASSASATTKNVDLGSRDSGPSTLNSIGLITPDNSFLLKYVVFHHFRSLGWVVRPGIKFAVDYLLYNRGPAFAHAEFGVMVIPSYSHPYWSDPVHKASHKQQEEKDWWWLHRVNRVQSHVHKTLILVYVEIPPPVKAETNTTDIGAVLKRYKVREFVVKRWTPNRHRD